MLATIREVIDHRELVWTFAYREIRVRYKQSVMGVLWAIFMPLVIVTAGVVVRYAYSVVSGTELTIENIASVSVKSIPWAFVVSSIRFCTMSLIGNSNLVTKIYLPRTVFPLSIVLAQSFDFLVASCALAVLLAIAGIGISWHVLFVPIILLVLLMQVLGVGIIASAASLFFRDVKYLIEVILTFAIFFTPVFYEVEMFGRYANVLMLNPVAPVLESLKACVVDHTMPPLAWLGYSAGIGIGVLVVAVALFRRLEPAFAESI